VLAFFPHFFSIGEYTAKMAKSSFELRLLGDILAMTMDLYFFNNSWISQAQAHISVNDLAVLRGYGVFDLLRTYNHKPFHLQAHLERLANSARLIGLHLPKPIGDLDAIIREGIAKCEHPECKVRILVTGGLSSDGITPDGTPQLIIIFSAATRLPPELFSNGAKVITSHVDRFLPGAKSINYIPAILCRQEARQRGAVESIYVDRDGYLMEGTTANLFVFRNNTLLTPPCDRVLPGITRQVVLQLAAGHFEVVQRPIHQDEIRLLDEAFITSSLAEILPVAAIDSLSVGGSAPGPLCRKLMALFAEYTHNYQG
jgi:branched-chain amino acid aminotransferase